MNWRGSGGGGNRCNYNIIGRETLQNPMVWSVAPIGAGGGPSPPKISKIIYIFKISLVLLVQWSICTRTSSVSMMNSTAGGCRQQGQTNHSVDRVNHIPNNTRQYSWAPPSFSPNLET